MPNTDAFAQRMTRAQHAFTRHVVDKVPPSALGPELGVSYDTARADVAAYRKHLAADQSEELAEKRRSFLIELDAVCARCLYLYDKYKDKKPLVASAALNSYIATMAHRRAVEGLDTPKEVKAEVDQRVSIIWDDSEPERKDYTVTAYPLPK